MEIVQAELENFEDVFRITQQTIQEVYPHYYPAGAVAFFTSHHSAENIRKDILAGCVWLLRDGEKNLATLTLNHNEVCRLFVLPSDQGRGYGRVLMDFAEQLILQRYTTVVLDASLPAQEMYQKRGYRAIQYQKVLCANGDYLCYNTMVLEKENSV